MKHSWLLSALLVAALPLSAAEMYSWTDANGVKHFSDSPPPASVHAQKLKVKGGVTSSEPAEETQQDAAAKAAGPALAAAAGFSPEMIKGNCDAARHNLTVLEAQKPALDAEGYPADPDGAKAHQADIDRANQQIKLFCAK
jgi:uncharacterized protein DUF4124